MTKASSSQVKNEVTFTINKKTFKVSSDTPVDTSLSTFIRTCANLPGTKTMCEEGGCGTCIVAVRFPHHPAQQALVHAVNSCLAPVFGCDGWDIVTIEGLGNQSDGYHPLQSLLAEHNGSQCGYCSPGMVLNMYSLMENNPKLLSKVEVENSFDGNICRCTGYRPILEAFKSVATDKEETQELKCQDIEDMLNNCLSIGVQSKACSSLKDCSGKCSVKNQLEESLTEETRSQSIFISTSNGKWYQATKKRDVFDIFKKIGEESYRFVAGNTAKGVYRCDTEYENYIDVSSLAALKTYDLSDAALKLGANLSLAQLAMILRHVAKANSRLYQYTDQLADHIALVANVAVRNVLHSEFAVSGFFLVFSAETLMNSAMKTQVIKPSLTLLDGTTYQKEFPAWVAANPGGMIAASMEQDKKLRPKQSSGSTQSVYYESLKWIFIVLTLAGILPVVKLRIGNHKLGAIIVGGICVGVYIVFGYYTYFLIKNVLFLIFHDDDFNTAISQVIMVMLLIQHVFYLILTWPESLAVNKYLAQWKNFQSQYEMLTGQELVLSCQRKLLFLMSVAFAMSASYPYLIGLTNKKQVLDSTSHVVLSYHIFILLNFYIMWLGNSWAVTQAAEQYNVQLTQECEGDITAERLEDYRLVWMRLSELVRAGSSMLAYTTALTVTTPFAYEVIAAYNLTMHVIRSIRTQGAPFVTMEALTTSATFLVFGMMLYSFCNSGHCMTLRCEKIQNVLLTHKPKLPSIATRVNSELRLFLRCLRSVPPLATLSGYVTVNRKVFLHMTGVLITYLIILVQFNIGSIKDTPASTSNNKTTS